jgi:hypothetical protein
LTDWTPKYKGDDICEMNADDALRFAGDISE